MRGRRTLIALTFIIAALLVSCAPLLPAQDQEVLEIVEEVEDEDVELGISAAEFLNKTTDDDDDLMNSIDDEPADEPSQEADFADGKLPTKVVKEGEKVSFPNLDATDPEGENITYWFTSPLNADGEWDTKEGDAGTYKVTVTASDGKNNVSQEIVVIVEEANAAPVIASLSDVTIKEGETVTLKPEVSDPDGDAVTTRYSGWMSQNSKTTTFADAGQYNVTVVASDGKTETTQTITVTVENLNRAPVLDSLGEVLNVKEGEKVTIIPTASDADGDKISYSFTAPLDDNGVWQTELGDAGSYRVNITASDGDLTDMVKLFIVVGTVNNEPVITLESSTITVDEGETVTINYEVSDSDGDTVDVTLSGWMTTKSYTTNYNDAGTHEVTISADDGKETASKTVTVVVEDVNRAPTFDPGSWV